MTSKFRLMAIVAAGALLAMPLMAAMTDPVQSRIAGYRDLGATFKAVNDSLRRGNASADQMQKLAGKIMVYSQVQYKWYPKGSGLRAGVKTAAKAEIWSKATQFRMAQDGFAKQAKAFQQSAASGDAAAWRASVRQLGASCKGCHDAFRVESD